MSHPFNFQKSNAKRAVLSHQMHRCASAITRKRSPSRDDLRQMLAEAARNTAALSLVMVHEGEAA